MLLSNSRIAAFAQADRVGPPWPSACSGLSAVIPEVLAGR